MVVDDERGFLNLFDSNFKKQIREKKYIFTKCLSGPEALKRLSTEKPDLILLDLLMPSMGGFELAEEINQNEDFSIPIVIVSTKAIPPNYTKGMEIRAFDFVNKNTLDFENLEERMDKTLLIAEEFKKKKPHSLTVLKNLKSLDLPQKFKVISKVIENDLNVEQIEILQEELPSYVELAREQKRHEEKLKEQDRKRIEDKKIPASVLDKAYVEIAVQKYTKKDGTKSEYNYIVLKWFDEDKKLRSKKLDRENWADPLVQRFVLKKVRNKDEKDLIGTLKAIAKLERKKWKTIDQLLSLNLLAERGSERLARLEKSQKL